VTSVPTQLLGVGDAVKVGHCACNVPKEKIKKSKGNTLFKKDALHLKEEKFAFKKGSLEIRFMNTNKLHHRKIILFLLAYIRFVSSNITDTGLNGYYSSFHNVYCNS